MPRKSRKKLSKTRKSKPKSRKPPCKKIIRKSAKNKPKSRKTPCKKIIRKSKRRRSLHHKTTSASSNTPQTEEQQQYAKILSAISTLISTGRRSTDVLQFDQAFVTMFNTISGQEGTIPSSQLSYKTVRQTFNNIWLHNLSKFNEIGKMFPGGSVAVLQSNLDNMSITFYNMLVVYKPHSGNLGVDKLFKLFDWWMGSIFENVLNFYESCLPDAFEFYQMFEFMQNKYDGLDFKWSNISLDKLNFAEQFGALVFFRYAFEGFANYLKYFQLISDYAKTCIYKYLQGNYQRFIELFGNEIDRNIAFNLDALFKSKYTDIESKIYEFEKKLKFNMCYCCKVLDNIETINKFVDSLSADITHSPNTVFATIQQQVQVNLGKQGLPQRSGTVDFANRVYNALFNKKQTGTKDKTYPTIFRIPITQGILNIADTYPNYSDTYCTDFKIIFKPKELETMIRGCLKELNQLGINESVNVKVAKEEEKLFMEVITKFVSQSNYGIRTLATLINPQDPSRNEFKTKCNLNENDKIAFHVRSTIDPFGVVQGIYDSTHDIKRNMSRITMHLETQGALPANQDTKIHIAHKIIADYSTRVLGRVIPTVNAEERSSIFSVIAAKNNPDRTSYIIDRDEQNPELVSLCSIEEYMDRNVTTVAGDLTSNFTQVKSVSFEDAGSPATGPRLRYDRRNGTINKWDNAPANTKTQSYRGEIEHPQWKQMNDLMNSAALLELIIPCDYMGNQDSDNYKFRVDIYSRRRNPGDKQFTEIVLEFFIYRPEENTYYLFATKQLQNNKATEDESDSNNGLSLTVAVDIAEVLYYTFMHNTVNEAEQYYDIYFNTGNEVIILWDMIKTYGLFDEIKQRNPGIVGLDLKYLGDQLYTINAEIFCQLNKIASTQLQYGDKLYNIFDSGCSLAYFVDHSSADYVALGSLLSSNVRLVDNLDSPNTSQYQIDMLLAFMLISLVRSDPPPGEFQTACLQPLPMMIGEKVQGVPIFDEYDASLNSSSKLKATVLIPQQYQNDLFKTFFNDQVSPRFMTQLIDCIKRKITLPDKEYDKGIKDIFMRKKKQIMDKAAMDPRNANMWNRFRTAGYPIIIRDIDELFGIYNPQTSNSIFAELCLNYSIPSGAAEEGSSLNSTDTGILTPQARAAIEKHLPLAFLLPAYVCVNQSEPSKELLLDSLDFGTLKTLFSINCIIGTNKQFYNVSEIGLVQDPDKEGRSVSESFSAAALVLINKFASKCTCPLGVAKLEEYRKSSGGSAEIQYGSVFGADKTPTDNFTLFYLEELGKICS